MYLTIIHCVSASIQSEIMPMCSSSSSSPLKIAYSKY